MKKKRWLDGEVWRKVGKWASIVFLALGVGAAVYALVEPLRRVFARGMQESGRGLPILSELAGLAIAIGLVALILLLGTTVILAREYAKAKNASAGKLPSAPRQAYETAVAAGNKIVNQLYPPEGQPQAVIEETQHKYTISDDGTMDAKVSHRFRANDQHVEFARFLLHAHSEADPIDFIDEIGFRTWPADPEKKVAYLVTENSPFLKRVAVFFLPRMEPGESREVYYAFRWVGCLKGFVKTGSENFSFRFDRQEQVGRLEVHLRFSRNLWPVTCETVGPLPGGCRLTESEEEKAWHFVADDVPAAGFEYQLRVARKL